MQGLPPAHGTGAGAGGCEGLCAVCCFQLSPGGVGLARGGAAPIFFCGLRPRFNGGGWGAPERGWVNRPIPKIKLDTVGLGKKGEHSTERIDLPSQRTFKHCEGFRRLLEAPLGANES